MRGLCGLFEEEASSVATCWLRYLDNAKELIPFVEYFLSSMVAGFFMDTTNLLESCSKDLIVRGMISLVRRGYVYVPFPR